MGKKLKDTKGNTLIYSSLFLLFIAMLFLVVFSFIQYKTTITHIKETAGLVLDEYTTEQGRKKAESIKNSTTYTPVLEKEQYSKLLSEALGVDSTLIGYRSGNVHFTISALELEFHGQNQINSKVSFYLEIPVYLGNNSVSFIRGDIIVRSKYNSILP